MQSNIVPCIAVDMIHTHTIHKVALRCGGDIKVQRCDFLGDVAILDRVRSVGLRGSSTTAMIMSITSLTKGHNTLFVGQDVILNGWAQTELSNT
jgi:hypothetical protein